MILPLSASESLSCTQRKRNLEATRFSTLGWNKDSSYFILSFLFQLPFRIPRACLNTLPTSHMDINKTGVPVGRTQY